MFNFETEREVIFSAICNMFDDKSENNVAEFVINYNNVTVRINENKNVNEDNTDKVEYYIHKLKMLSVVLMVVMLKYQ